MNRQYIGARYVPKFYENSDHTNEWRSGVAYEALTIVTYNGNSYTSKIPVPASIGNPSSNPSYWASTGIYSQQVESLRQQVADLEETVDSMETEVDANTQSIANIINDTGLTEIALFGDSWADYTHDPDNVRIPAVLANKLGVNVHNYTYGGTGFEVEHGYLDQINDFIADTTFDHSKIKCYILVAGINEYHAGHGEDYFRQQLDIFVTRLKTHLDRPIYWFHNYSMENRLNGKMCTYYPQFNYYNSIQLSIQKKCICPLTFGWVQSWNTANYFHPNTNGSITFANNMVNVINGAPVKIYKYDTITATWEGSAAAGFRRFITDFYVEGETLRARMYIALGGLYNTTEGIVITPPRPYPMRLPNNVYFGNGCALLTSDNTSIQFVTVNQAERVWTTSMSGGKYVEVTLDPA